MDKLVGVIVCKSETDSKIKIPRVGDVISDGCVCVSVVDGKYVCCVTAHHVLSNITCSFRTKLLIL